MAHLARSQRSELPRAREVCIEPFSSLPKSLLGHRIHPLQHCKCCVVMHLRVQPRGQHDCLQISSCMDVCSPVVVSAACLVSYNACSRYAEGFGMPCSIPDDGRTHFRHGRLRHGSRRRGHDDGRHYDQPLTTPRTTQSQASKIGHVICMLEREREKIQGIAFRI